MRERGEGEAGAAESMIREEARGGGDRGRRRGEDREGERGGGESGRGEGEEGGQERGGRKRRRGGERKRRRGMGEGEEGEGGEGGGGGGGRRRGGGGGGGEVGCFGGGGSQLGWRLRLCLVAIPRQRPVRRTRSGLSCSDDCFPCVTRPTTRRSDALSHSDDARAAFEVGNPLGLRKLPHFEAQSRPPHGPCLHFRPRVTATPARLRSRPARYGFGQMRLSLIGIRQLRMNVLPGSGVATPNGASIIQADAPQPARMATLVRVLVAE